MTLAPAFDVAILAGGRGTRLRDRTGRLPKPMVAIEGKPLLAHQVELCARHGFGRILLLVHHEHEVIRAEFGDGTRYGVRIDYEVEQTPGGTAGALSDALPRLADTFLVLYGDTYLDVDLRRLWEAHTRRGADATLLVHPSDHPQDSDMLELDADGVIRALYPYPRPEQRYLRNFGNAALYVVQRSAIAQIPAGKRPSDLVRDTFPAMLRAGQRLLGYVSPEYIKDIGTPERLDRVARDIRAGLPELLSGRQLRCAVFLDRDGTLNKEVDHLRTPEQVELLEGVAGAVRRLNEAGRLALVITNQPVIARGEVEVSVLDAIHARLEHLLGLGGAYLDAIYVCPHHPDRGFPGEIAALKIACDCRKPRTGSIDAACRDLEIDRKRSWMVGDTTADMEAGRRAGLTTVLVRTGYAGQDGRYAFRPDYVAADLPAAVSWILEGHGAMAGRLAPVAAAALETKLVLVGGLARAGKSSAAQVLKELMAASGRTVHVLSLDSWLRPAAERSEGTGVAARFDLEAAAAAVRPLLSATSRVTLQLPVYDRARRTQLPNRLNLSIAPEDLVIVEGVPALLGDDLARLAGLRVYIEMPEPRRIAHLRADYRWRGATDATVDALLASRALDESGPVQQSRGRADVVVPAWTDQ